MIARPFIGEPGNYTRTPNRHDFSLVAGKPNYLTLLRDNGVKVHGVGKIGDIFANQDIDESQSTKSNIDGIQVTEKLLQELDEGFIFVNLVETDMPWGHRNDPVNFHRCLQDFDRRLPDLLEALRPGDLLIVTSDHGCDPTTLSRIIPRVRDAACVRRRPQRVGADPRGASSPMSARPERMAQRKVAGRGIPGQPIITRLTPIPELIARKRDGGELTAGEINELILGDVPDYQLAAFCMAVFFGGMSSRETFAFTDAMVRSGERIDGEALARVVDKHSTGGVGDKATLAVGPIVAACGVPFAKMSGRGLGHTAARSTSSSRSRAFASSSPPTSSSSRFVTSASPSSARRRTSSRRTGSSTGCGRHRDRTARR